jgi:hypothetical protein
MTSSLTLRMGNISNPRPFVSADRWAERTETAAWAAGLWGRPDVRISIFNFLEQSGFI